MHVLYALPCSSCWSVKITITIIFGAQNITTDLCFSPGMRILIHFTSGTHGDKCPSAVRIPSNAGRECALEICSFSGLRNSFFYVRTVTSVRAWIYTDDTGASRLQAKGRRCYLSQNFGPAVAGSAERAPPPLLTL